MSMHLMHPGFTIINTKKSKKKKKSKALLKAELSHMKFLRSHGIHSDQSKPRKVIPNYESNSSSQDPVPIPTSDNFHGSTTKKPEKRYTGDYIIGLATMHKSNIVPVSRGDDPKIYAKMRR